MDVVTPCAKAPEVSPLKPMGGHPALALIFLAACGTNPAAERTDLESYMRHVRAWARVEAEAGQAIDRILATQFVDDDEVRRQIAESRMRVQTHVLELRSPLPSTTAVGRVHKQYVETWQELLKAYDQIELGLDRGDQVALARGRAGLLEWRRDLRSVATELRALVDRYGLPGAGTKDGLPVPTDRPSS